MGVIHKLKQELKSWVIEKKRTNPTLSCRNLVSLIEEEFKIPVSKSSINALFKEAGLSMPVGRRQKKRRIKSSPSTFPLEIAEKTELSMPLLTGPQTEALLPAPPKEPSEPHAPVPEPILELPAPTPIPVPEPPTTPPEPSEPHAPVPEPILELPVAPPKPEPPEPIPAPIPEEEIPEDTPAQPPIEATSDVAEEIPTHILQKMLSSGAILLKAADCLIDASYAISEIIKRRLNLRDEYLLAKVESLIYAPCLEPLGAPLNLYINELKGATDAITDIHRAISRLFTAVRCVKILLSNGEGLYLDGEWHTVWSVPHIPYEFANTVYSIKNDIKKAFYEEEPLILFMAPGYDRPTAEFYNFILSLGCGKPRISGLSLYGNKLQEIEYINLEQYKNYFLIFGLWPWQFTEYRQIRKVGDFKPFYFQALNKNLHIADIVLDLKGLDKDDGLTLSGCALKASACEKTRLMILTNLPEGSVQSEYLADLYLNRWPNMEEAFQDFSRKVELFTYTAGSQQLFSPQGIKAEHEISDMEHLFKYYLDALDSYFKRRFLPCGYAEKDFFLLKEEFYQIKASIEQLKGYSVVNFSPPSDPDSLKALRYACRRLNERMITLKDYQRLWFKVKD